MKKIALILFISFFFLQCTNNKPLPNSYDLLDREGKSGLMPPITFRPSRMADYRQVKPAGSAGSVLLGSYRNLSSSIILDCQNFASAGVDTSAELVSAELHFYTIAETDSNLAVTVNVHQVQTAWSESGVIADSIKDSYSTETLFSGTLTQDSLKWAILPISNLDFMSAWIKDDYLSTSLMQGLLIKCDLQEQMIEFASTDVSASSPFFKIVTHDTSDVYDTTFVYLSKDASLLEYSDSLPPLTLQESPELLRVGDGSGYRSLISFDLSSIPEAATIHKALLNFKVNAANSNTGADGEMSLSILAVKADSVWEKPGDLTVYSLTSPPTDAAVASNEYFAFDSSTPVKDISRIVQRWVIKSWGNNGFLLYAGNEGKDWQEMAFYSGAQDSLLAPTLTVTYSLPAEYRFSNP
jgi:hypothetical protein